MTESKHISNLYAYLKATKENEIIVRTTRVSGVWDDVQSSASSAGFGVSVFQNQEYLARHEFAECYRFVRL